MGKVEFIEFFVLFLFVVINYLVFVFIMSFVVFKLMSVFIDEYVLMLCGVRCICIFFLCIIVIVVCFE